MNIAVFTTVFGLVFIGELPDKTMFASLLLATRGNPIAVWAGATLAFTVHVAIAVSVGAAIVHLLPHRVAGIVVAALFAAGSLYSFLLRNQNADDVARGARSAGTALAAAAVVIFLAEWGDLTQILIANLAARYHDWLSVSVAALSALTLTAALAVTSGAHLLDWVRVSTLRVITAAALAGLAAYTLVEAL